MNTQTARPTVPSPFWWRWLIVATVLIIVTGLSMVMAPEPVSRMFGAILSSPVETFGETANAYLLLFQGVLGGTMAGWGMAFMLVLFGSFRRGSKEGWMTIAASLATWFILDSSFSLWTGFWQNAALNAVFLLLFAIPLAATYRTFFPK
ncbi:MAG: hypothetical protein HY865_03130 [Chloroflexi bacterium]|nr:hypothetical protein [Chloroflexota bacterium]